MKHKVSELTGVLLDAAVAKALDWHQDKDDASCWWTTDGSVKCIAVGAGFMPSSTWNDGGPIIERERIGTWFEYGEWHASYHIDSAGGTLENCGPTPLIAAMRAYVASKFGEEIEL